MNGVGAEYAKALYSLAKEDDLTDRFLRELEVLDAAFAQEPEYLRLLTNPNLSKDERIGILDTGFRGKVHPYILNFLKLLTQKGYARRFPDCVKAYRTQYNEENGIVSVLAVSAVALTDAQSEKLRSKLETVTGKKVDLQFRTDPACIGGVRLDYDGRRVDGTVKNRLDSMRELLNNTVK